MVGKRLEAVRRRLKQCACVRRYQDEVGGGVECASPLRGFADSCMYELTRIIGSSNAEGPVVLAFPRNMCAKVWFVA